MKQVFYIVLAALLTLATSYSLGVFLLRGLKLKLERSAERFIAFVSGSALLSTLVFLLTAAGLARKSWFLVAALPIIALGVWKKAWRAEGGETVPESWPWRAVFWTLFAVFTWYYLGNALSPEVSPDGTVYHVGLPVRYLREHRFPAITANMYAALSQGIEMLFLFAYSIGRHSATAMVHFLFLIALPFGIRSYARSIQQPVAGIVAALLVYLSPIVARDGTVAYVDVAAAAVAFALFYALQLWRGDKSKRGWLVLIGLLAGFAFAVKYTLGLAIAWALVIVLSETWRNWRQAFRAVLLVGVCALAMMAPWLVKNAIIMRNPLAPFANRLFPNPYMYASFEQEYVEFFRHMNNVTLKEIPLEVTVKGDRLTGLVGPVFLLAPLALISLRRREGRQLLLASLVFLIPYFNNIGTRFLIPMLPFTALALAMVLAEWRAAAGMVTVTHAFLSWPGMILLYSGSYVWRLERPSWDAALRRIPEEQYIRQNRDDYDILRMLEKESQPGDWVYSPATANMSYSTRNLVGAFESRLGQRTTDMLYRITSADMHTTLRHRFRVPETTVRKVRVVINATDKRPLLVSEIRYWRGGVEIPRGQGWRLRASINPWEVQSAFDNSPLTVWTVGDQTRPGYYIETDFGATQAVDEVTVEVPLNQQWASFRLEASPGDGTWKALGGEAERVEIPWPARMRRAAIEQMESDGFRWLLVRNDDTIGRDIAERAVQWGVKFVGEANNCRLWRLD